MNLGLTYEYSRLCIPNSGVSWHAVFPSPSTRAPFPIFFDHGPYGSTSGDRLRAWDTFTRVAKTIKQTYIRGRGYVDQKRERCDCSIRWL